MSFGRSSGYRTWATSASAERTELICDLSHGGGHTAWDRSSRMRIGRSPSIQPTSSGTKSLPIRDSLHPMFPAQPVGGHVVDCPFGKEGTAIAQSHHDALVVCKPARYGRHAFNRPDECFQHFSHRYIMPGRIPGVHRAVRKSCQPFATPLRKPIVCPHSFSGSAIVDAQGATKSGQGSMSVPRPL